MSVKIKMCRFYISCLLILSCLVNYLSGDDECQKKWPDCLVPGNVMATNTMCMEAGCGPRFAACIELPRTPEFRRGMLEKHNELRNKLASGADTRGGNEAATNMMAFSYDSDLEYGARCHANMCLFDHDKCRGTEKFPEAGQNLAVTHLGSEDPYLEEDIDKITTTAHFQSLINEWYEEITLADFTETVNSYVFSKPVGHFTALVWATTTHVGCAASVNRTSTTEAHVHLTCNYGPIGNTPGMPIYKKGPSCTECPSGVSCNTKYTGLCGEIDEKAIDSGEEKTAGKQSQVLVYFAVILSALYSF